jgi:nitrate reductase gamma subunit
MASSSHAPADVESPVAGGKRRLTPSQVSIAIGGGLALVTAVSGISGAINTSHVDNEISREVFWNIPSALELAFYVALPLLFLFGGIAMSNRVKNWQRGTPDDRTTTTKNAKRRMADFRAGVYMKTLMRDRAAGLMHSLIYFGFLGLFAVTTVLEIDHQMPKSLKFLQGRTYQTHNFFGDFFGVLFVTGIVWAIGRRYIQRPYRIRIKNRPEDAVILGMFLVLGLSGFFAEAFRVAAAGRPSWEQSGFVGYTLSALFTHTRHLKAWHQAAWMTHVLSFGLFLVILPITKLRHMFTSPMNMYLKDRDAKSDGNHAGDVRRCHHRRLHLEATARYRCLHHVRTLHGRMPCPCHRKAARPA